MSLRFWKGKKKQHEPWSLTGTLNVLKANNNWAVPCEKVFERTGKVYRPGSDIFLNLLILKINFKK
jgi:hypothetical protein